MQVYDRSPQVRVERVGHAQVPESSDDPNERLLDEVLGLLMVGGEQVGEPSRRRRVPNIQLGEPSLGLLLTCHLGAHHRTPRSLHM